MSGDQSYHGSVVQYLQEQFYTDIKQLGKGSYGEVLSAISPQKKNVAVKIISQENYWRVEEEIWPLLYHPNVLPVLDMMSLSSIGLNLFVSPRHPTALGEMVHSKEFMADIKGLDRIRKWMKDILSGMDYLHTSGFSHMDIKSDNVLITASDSAVLCDFSGLALTAMKITRLCAPLTHRPPECYHATASKGVDGIPFDMWTFGFMALNVMTLHQVQSRMVVCDGWSWEVHARSILVQALQDTIFSMLMRQAMPCVKISTDDICSARHFLLSLMQLDPATRPNAKKAACHIFLRTSSVSHGPENAQSSISEVVANASGDAKPPGSSNFSFVNEETTTAVVEEAAQVTVSGDCPTRSDPDSLLVETEQLNSDLNGAKTKGLRKRLKTWFGKGIRRIFPKKNKYVILSNDSSD